jgi:sensor histidine kinase YesM
LLGGIGVGLLSAWFGHFKFKLSFRGSALLVLITAAGAVVGSLAAAATKSGDISLVDAFVRMAPTVLMAGLIIGAVYTGIISAVVLVRRKQLEARNLLLVRELTYQANEARLARQLTDAKLKLMQAQVEPHFLFNTLASVQHLAEANAPDAAALTHELITFLRAGLGGLRDETTTLAREFEMAEAYLAIMRTRMGERLSYSFHLPLELCEMSMPPAMLISLVENAIKHGIEPATNGGKITVSAEKAEDTLTITVRDTGMGLQQASNNTGVGLSNVRERLQAIFGELAQLTITENLPRGVCATIAITMAATTDKKTDGSIA